MRTTARIRNFRASRRGRHRPSTDLSPKEEVIDKIFNNLYTPHWKFWRGKLLEIITQNKDYHGQDGAPDNFGVFYVGKAWFVPLMPDDDVSAYTVLPLHEHYPDMEKELIKVTSNLAELDIECYEVKRFLAGLLIHGAPMDIMEKALGAALFSRVVNFLQELRGRKQARDWNEATQVAFDTYLEQHDYLLAAMCQRVMMNLITRDAFARQ